MPEYLIPFKMKPYYMSLRAKMYTHFYFRTMSYLFFLSLVHLEGTLKLFDEFLSNFIIIFIKINIAGF